jgi:hypothetical protein
MQRKRRSGRVEAQSYVVPEIVQARSVKSGTRDLICYEHAYYTSQARNHVAGTNEYQFEYEGSWRTRTGELVFGVRGLYLKKCPARVFSVITKLFHQDKSRWIDTQFVVDYKLTVRSEHTIGDVIEKLNEILEDAWDKNSKLAIRVAHHYEWRLDRNTGNVQLQWRNADEKKPDEFKWQYVLPMNPDCGFDKEGGYTFLLDMNDKVSTEVLMTLDNGQVIMQEAVPTTCCCCGQQVGSTMPTPEPIPTPPPSEDPVGMPSVLGDPFIVMWDREDVLIRASFVQQTQNQHLGFTGIDYNTPKKYQIIHNSPQFTITLWSQSTLQPVELPADNRDYVVMECVVYRDYNV